MSGLFTCLGCLYVCDLTYLCHWPLSWVPGELRFLFQTWQDSDSDSDKDDDGKVGRQRKTVDGAGVVDDGE